MQLNIIDSQINLGQDISLNNSNVIPYQEMFGDSSSYTMVVGDLHGNAWKLLVMLYQLGLIKAKSDVFWSLWQAYFYSSRPGFLKFLNRIEVTCLKDQISLLFLGNCLAGQGNSDIMTLAIIDFLRQNKVEFWCLLGNHDLYFMRQYITFKESYSFADNSFSLNNKITQDQTRSFDLRNVYPNEMIGVASFYKSYLSSLIFTYYVEGLNNVYVFTHAPLKGNILYDMKIEETVRKNNSFIRTNAKIDFCFCEKLEKLLGEDLLNSKVELKNAFSLKGKPIINIFGCIDGNMWQEYDKSPNICIGSLAGSLVGKQYEKNEIRFAAIGPGNSPYKDSIKHYNTVSKNKMEQNKNMHLQKEASQFQNNQTKNQVKEIKLHPMGGGAFKGVKTPLKNYVRGLLENGDAVCPICSANFFEVSQDKQLEYSNDSIYVHYKDNAMHIIGCQECLKNSTVKTCPICRGEYNRNFVVSNGNIEDYLGTFMLTAIVQKREDMQMQEIKAYLSVIR